MGEGGVKNPENLSTSFMDGPKAGGAAQKGVNKHVHFTINRHFC